MIVKSHGSGIESRSGLFRKFNRSLRASSVDKIRVERLPICVESSSPFFPCEREGEGREKGTIMASYKEVKGSMLVHKVLKLLQLTVHFLFFPSLFFLSREIEDREREREGGREEIRIFNRIIFSNDRADDNGDSGR